MPQCLSLCEPFGRCFLIFVNAYSEVINESKPELPTHNFILHQQFKVVASEFAIRIEVFVLQIDPGQC